MKNKLSFVVLSLLLVACQKTDIQQENVNLQEKTAPVSVVGHSSSYPTSAQKRLKEQLTVNRDANCGCCHQWIEHAKADSWVIKDVVLSSNAKVAEIKDQYAIAPEMRSCHTTVSSSGYVFEGHVPMKAMITFLENPPENAIGLAVPGMPVGSVGMEDGGHFMPYEVMQLNHDGTYQVFAKIDQPSDQY
ncbi:DUF411 domain-containing protein [Neisseria weixii]|uniref:DUF411 domain-containing protein n=1 Tax=Neisseria weixii TaxID=1853276 RepID=UPI003624327F